jgi:hypothetical protein
VIDASRVLYWRLNLGRLCWSRASHDKLDQIVGDRGDSRVDNNRYHNSSLPAQPLARKLLILQVRRDVRVVEGARLEIALTVCDGVLRIAITVAKPTT